MIETSTIISHGCVVKETAGGTQVSLRFDKATSVLYINDIIISDFNIFGDYGVFNGIDTVMVEGVQGDFVPCPPFSADFSPIRNRGIYLGLMNALTNSGAADEISANAPVTIFGPNDISFGTVTNVVNSYNQAQFKQLALKHTLFGEALTVADIVQAGCLEKVTAGGLDIDIRYNNTLDQVTVNGIVVSDFGIQGEYSDGNRFSAKLFVC